MNMVIILSTLAVSLGFMMLVQQQQGLLYESTNLLIAQKKRFYEIEACVAYANALLKQGGIAPEEPRVKAAVTLGDTAFDLGITMREHADGEYVIEIDISKGNVPFARVESRYEKIENGFLLSDVRHID